MHSIVLSRDEVTEFGLVTGFLLLLQIRDYM
jgi:hypothetical protein